MSKHCLFCGSSKLVTLLHRTSGATMHYVSQVMCRSCGSRGPVVKSDNQDWREGISAQQAEQMKQTAMAKYKPLEEKDPKDFKLES